MHPIFHGIWALIMMWPREFILGGMVTVLMLFILRRSRQASDQLSAEIDNGYVDPWSVFGCATWVVTGIALMVLILFMAMILIPSSEPLPW